MAGIEARGFILGGAVAHALSAGFIPLRKKGKLPHTAISVEYELEYGADRMEMHIDGCAHGDRVAIVDDLIATGGTALAAVQLLRRAGARVEAAAPSSSISRTSAAPTSSARSEIDVSALVAFDGR